MENMNELDFSVETGILVQNKQFKSNVCEKVTANMELYYIIRQNIKS